MRDVVCRISEELSVPVHSHCSLLPPSSNHEVEQHSRSQETAVNHNCEGTFVDMPPSFTSLLTNCCFETQGRLTAQVIVTRIFSDSFFMTHFS